MAGRNQPLPPSVKGRDVWQEQKQRRIRQVITATDRAELEKHYSFLPPSNRDTAKKLEEMKNKSTTTASGGNGTQSSSLPSSSWQDRMVQHYHSHLYKEFVLADLTRPGQLGLRWRTEAEVHRGRGHRTCGNKHCPTSNNDPSLDHNNSLQMASYDDYKAAATSQSEGQERSLIDGLAFGLGLHDYEVPFRYSEHGQTKDELVKLRLCLRCAPLLFRKPRKRSRKKYDVDVDVDTALEDGHKDNESGYSSGGPYLAARRARERYHNRNDTDGGDNGDGSADNNEKGEKDRCVEGYVNPDADLDSDDDTDSSNERRKKRRRRRKERKRERREKKQRRKDEKRRKAD